MIIKKDTFEAGTAPKLLEQMEFPVLAAVATRLP